MHSWSGCITFVYSTLEGTSDMILIIGGAYQGKHRYAQEHYTDRAVYYVQSLIKEAQERNTEATAYIEQIMLREPEAVFILDDVGGGIVPIDRKDRDYRELVGRIGCMLADSAQSVIRVCCGIGQVIK